MLTGCEFTGKLWVRKDGNCSASNATAQRIYLVRDKIIGKSLDGWRKKKGPDFLRRKREEI